MLRCVCVCVFVVWCFWYWLLSNLRNSRIHLLLCVRCRWYFVFTHTLESWVELLFFFLFAFIWNNAVCAGDRNERTETIGIVLAGRIFNDPLFAFITSCRPSRARALKFKLAILALFGWPELGANQTRMKLAEILCVLCACTLSYKMNDTDEFVCRRLPTVVWMCGQFLCVHFTSCANVCLCRRLYLFFILKLWILIFIG